MADFNIKENIQKRKITISKKIFNLAIHEKKKQLNEFKNITKDAHNFWMN